MTHYIMDKTLRQDTMWKKPNTKDNMLCDSIYMKHAKYANSEKSGFMFARRWRIGEGRVTVYRYEVPVWDEENVLELYNKDQCITLWVC
jgi:hypothetical protein